MGVLKFDNVDDQLKWTSVLNPIGQLTAGAYTIAVLCKFETLSDFNALAYLMGGPGHTTPLGGMSFSSSVNSILYDVGVGRTFPSDITSTTSPYIFVLSKAAGTTTPRLGWKLGTGGAWTHENADGTMDNQGAATNLQIGTWTDTDEMDGWIGLVAMWSGAMSDAHKEALDNNWSTSDWWNSDHGEPVFLAELNVAASSVVDLAGNVSSPSHTAPTLDSGETLSDWNFDGAGVSRYDSVVLSLNPDSYYPTSDGVDAGANGFDMTLVGSPVAVRSLVPSDPGAINGGLQFDGSTQRAHLGDVYNFAGDWSMAGWLKIQQNPIAGFRRVFEKRATTDPFKGFLLYVYEAASASELSVANFNFDIDHGASDEGQGIASAFKPYVTAFVTLVWDNADPQLHVYWNGLYQGAATSYTTALSGTNTGEFTFGAPSSGTGGNNFMGILSKWAIWEGVKLTAENHEAMWKAGLGDYGVNAPRL